MVKQSLGWVKTKQCISHLYVSEFDIYSVSCQVLHIISAFFSDIHCSSKMDTTVKLFSLHKLKGKRMKNASGQTSWASFMPLCGFWIKVGILLKPGNYAVEFKKCTSLEQFWIDLEMSEAEFTDHAKSTANCTRNLVFIKI